MYSILISCRRFSLHIFADGVYHEFLFLLSCYKVVSAFQYAIRVSLTCGPWVSPTLMVDSHSFLSRLVVFYNVVSACWIKALKDQL